MRLHKGGSAEFLCVTSAIWHRTFREGFCNVKFAATHDTGAAKNLFGLQRAFAQRRFFLEACSASINVDTIISVFEEYTFESVKESMVLEHGHMIRSAQSKRHQLDRRLLRGRPQSARAFSTLRVDCAIPRCRLGEHSLCQEVCELPR